MTDPCEVISIVIYKNKNRNTIRKGKNTRAQVLTLTIPTWLSFIDVWLQFRTRRAMLDALLLSQTRAPFYYPKERAVCLIDGCGPGPMIHLLQKWYALDDIVH